MRWEARWHNEINDTKVRKGNEGRKGNVREEKG